MRAEVLHTQQTLLPSTMALIADSDNNENWITDSDATQHMSSQDVNMRNYKSIEIGKKFIFVTIRHWKQRIKETSNYNAFYLMRSAKILYLGKCYMF